MSPTLVKRRRHPSTLWAKHQQLTIRLYRNELKPLHEIVAILKKRHDFQVTEASLKQKLHRWKIKRPKAHMPCDENGEEENNLNESGMVPSQGTAPCNYTRCPVPTSIEKAMTAEDFNELEVTSAPDNGEKTGASTDEEVQYAGRSMHSETMPELTAAGGSPTSLTRSGFTVEHAEAAPSDATATRFAVSDSSTLSREDVLGTLMTSTGFENLPFLVLATRINRIAVPIS